MTDHLKEMSDYLKVMAEASKKPLQVTPSIWITYKECDFKVFYFSDIDYVEVKKVEWNGHDVTDIAFLIMDQNEWEGLVEQRIIDINS